MKKVIVAGSREFDNYKLLAETLDNIYPTPIEVVCGGARGADSFGRFWATKHDYPYTTFTPNWQKEGKSAGYNRNVAMADYADEAVVFWDGQSKGSQHMINIMKGIGKPVKVVNYA